MMNYPKQKCIEVYISSFLGLFFKTSMLKIYQTVRIFVELFIYTLESSYHCSKRQKVVGLTYSLIVVVFYQSN